MDPALISFGIVMLVIIGIFSLIVLRRGAFSGPPAPEDVAGPPEAAEVRPSGLASVVLEPGSGDTNPTVRDTVTVHYTGWTTDGKCFDSSVARDRPATFPLMNVVEGWKEGIPLMTVGERRRLWIPADLAYGERPGPGMPAGMLVFDVELLSID